MIDRNRTRPVLHVALALAIIVAPIVHAADDERIQVAVAIGGENKQQTPPPGKTTPPPAKTPPSAPADTGPAFEGFETSTWIWIGVGAAALLAALGGGGGGGGGDSTPQH